MRRRTARQGLSERADPNLIPLLDVVLQLITFFMMLVHLATRIEGATEAVRLPSAPAALPATDLGLDRLSVALDGAGRLRFEDKAYEPDAAETFWEEQAETRRKGLAALGRAPEAELPTLVVLRADRELSY